MNSKKNEISFSEDIYNKSKENPKNDNNIYEEEEKNIKIKIKKVDKDSTDINNKNGIKDELKNENKSKEENKSEGEISKKENIIIKDSKYTNEIKNDIKDENKSKEEERQNKGEIKIGDINYIKETNNEIGINNSKSNDIKNLIKILELYNNISDKNKDIIKLLLFLLNNKNDYIKSPHINDIFLKLLKELEQNEKNYIIEKNDNMISKNVATNEEKFQNLKKIYMILKQSNGKSHAYYKIKYFKDYVEGKCPNLEIIEKQYKGINKNENKNVNNNILFLSLDKLYDIKKKNSFNILNETNNEYNCYNYKIILNNIENRLNNFKNSKVNNKVKNLKKSNSYFHNNILEEKKDNDKNYSKNVRIKNIIKQIKDGIKSIENQKNQTSNLKRVFSGKY